MVVCLACLCVCLVGWFDYHVSCLVCILFLFAFDAAAVTVVVVVAAAAAHASAAVVAAVIYMLCA